MIHFRMNDYYFYSGFGEIFIFLLLIAFSVGVFVLMTVTKFESSRDKRPLYEYWDEERKYMHMAPEGFECFWTDGVERRKLFMQPKESTALSVAARPTGSGGAE